MSRLRQPRGLALWLLLLPFVWEAGCSRPVGLSGPEGATPDHQVPFHEGDGNASDERPATGTEKGLKPGTDPSSDNPSSDNRSSGNLPSDNLPFAFGDAQSLPAGTLLVVRLKNSVSADNPESSGTFEAIVDEPVTVEGSTLLPRGASVFGRIESAHTPSARGSAQGSELKRNGYVRLTLNSIELVGKDMVGKVQVLRTSSLFARGGPSTPNDSRGRITLEKGRRLTFRLTEPVYLAAQQSSAGH